ncbi:hypothetical protein [Spirosoma sordidisoli]|uniref:Capsid protein n=1 Tax=Spirosoma sordidisoli TaxID=2502893 RepID=A0A4Q2UN84_9BACT|nr:hypothetical protein [Spirosoma sordidisoli]RYC70874.1 hypothetical protein EQG79_01600 [Spirosoma sordidisoli]
MAITNMTLPELIASINSGQFGKLEGRMSHYGAINTLYRNANALFGAALIELIRKQPFTRTIKIPIFDKYNHTVLTVRSCDINCQDIGTRLKALTRTHLAIDICINPSDYENNYVLMEQALRHRYTMAKKAVYTKLDEMAAAFIDANKDTTMVVDPANGPNASPLFKGKAGAYELPTSLKFYSFLQTIMEQMDIQGPYFDLHNTVAMADTNLLGAPGGGNVLATDKLMAGAQIVESDHSNRLAVGSALPVHYIAPIGSVGVVNIIDGVYRDKPVIGSPEDFTQWERFKDVTEVKLWGQTPDEVFNDWDWGVLQEHTCVDETILYKTKFSADFTFACDFTSVAGESPIKRFDIAAIAA